MLGCVRYEYTQTQIKTRTHILVLQRLYSTAHSENSKLFAKHAVEKKIMYGRMDDRSLPQLRLIIVPHVPRRPDPGECLQIAWRWVGYSNQQVTLPTPKTRSAYSWVQYSKNSREFAYLLEFMWIYCLEGSALWDVEISNVSVGKYRNAEYTHIHKRII